MTESFLHYVWQFQYFAKEDLCTASGETVSVYHPGTRNPHAGPDFFNARIRIDGIDWVGSVEIHTNAAAWFEHKHDNDRAYDNVILHVVWKDDKKILRKDGSLLPALELKSRIDPSLVLHYRKLINTGEEIPCRASLARIPSITKLSMLEKALMGRLELKAEQIRVMYERNNHDWEETAYQLLCRNFGFKVNADPFQQLAQSLPYKVVLRHADHLLQVEAMLFGQAGFLEEKREDPYYAKLKREYTLLDRKYNLEERQLKKAQWRFLRLRPANFPTLRLAQLSALLAHQKNIFSRIMEATTYRDLIALFSAKQSVYWQHHYQFFKGMDEEVPAIGVSSIDTLIINTVVPLLASYGRMHDEQQLVDRAVEILQHISPEDNVIIKRWHAVGLRTQSAADSQGLIELHNNFCQKRRCLECTIGFSILQPASA
jgi:hypothetical protein